MIEPTANQGLFNINRPLVENRNRVAPARTIENDVAPDRNIRPDAEETTSRNSQRVESLRSTEALQRTERESPRVRRDDNSDLSFQARQALNQFNQIETETLEPNEPVITGVDLFV